MFGHLVLRVREHGLVGVTMWGGGGGGGGSRAGERSGRLANSTGAVTSVFPPPPSSSSSSSSYCVFVAVRKTGMERVTTSYHRRWRRVTALLGPGCTGVRGLYAQKTILIIMPQSGPP